MKVLPGGWTLSYVGDCAIVAECEQEISPELNSRVLKMAQGIRSRERSGIRDVVESYCGVTVYFDPLKVDISSIISDLSVEIIRWCDVQESCLKGRLIRVPVCYGGIYGPDLQEVADFAECSEEEVIKRHTAVVYRVYMLGFLPGFAYMGSVAPSIAVSRRSTPRLNVPVGSVGIAERQTGVYPLAGPGGWQLIGRTPLAVIKLGPPMVFVFHPGDKVQFEAISSEVFDDLSTAV